MSKAWKGLVKLTVLNIFVVGVQKIIVAGSSLRTSREALRLARIYPGTLYSTAGKHDIVFYDLLLFENSVK